MRAGTAGLGVATLDLDHPLGRQARGAGLDQAVDNIRITKPAHVRVGQSEASELALCYPSRSRRFTLLQGEEAGFSCRSSLTPTFPVRSFCVCVSASCWDIFGSVFIIHSLSFVRQAGEPDRAP